MDNFKHAIVYGKSCKHQPQRVGLSHELADEDIGKYKLLAVEYFWAHVLASHDCQTLEKVS